MSRVTRLTVEAATADDVCRGSGCVKTVRPAPDVLRWTARGRWESGRGAALAFESAYEWRRSRGRLLLAHLRRGPETPVALVELVPHDAADLFVSAQPHCCGEDVYAARLYVGAAQIELQWDIAGPRKSIRLQQCYHA